MSAKNSKTNASASIAQNRKARHDFIIEETYEAGLVLQGWELKSIRAGRIQISDAFVQLHQGEAWLHGAVITPLPSASTHVVADAQRNRKLLLNRREIDQLAGAIERKGMTAVALSMYWKSGRVKASVGLARGKKQHDKRASEKARDWQREKTRILKSAK